MRGTKIRLGHEPRNVIHPIGALEFLREREKREKER